MTELDQAIAAAYSSEGKQEDVNKVYLTLLRSPLLLPVRKDQDPSDEEPFRPLFTVINDEYFMLAFDTLDRLKGWAGEQMENIAYVELSGRDLVAGINEKVYLCINLDTEYYKEFSPDEMLQLKKIVARLDQLKGS
jgi:hypothetical protein